MPFFGPKTVDAKGDTVYWSVPEIYFKGKTDLAVNVKVDSAGNETQIKNWRADTLILDTTNYPVYVILFLDEKFKKDGYKLDGIFDYVKYKQKDIKQVPIILVSDFNELLNNNSTFDSLQLKLSNFSSLTCDLSKRDKFLLNTYFKQKPIYVFDYFMVLVDKKRHVRGYYDPSYNAEVKRMIDEYKHLKIRDGYAETLKQNEIKQDK